MTAPAMSSSAPHRIRAGALSPRERSRSRELPGLPPGPHLAVVDDQGGVAILALPLGATSLGRSLRADVRLDDSTVSRRHALVVRDGGRTVVLDDHSLNGVFVNGAAIESAELRDGDVIALGRVRVYYLDVRRPATPARR
jgi:pSer/pThr/pTyr-binding forkhead associated (FHA) protein